MKNNEGKRRLALTVLFSGAIFIFLTATMLIVGFVIITLVHNGVLEFNKNAPAADGFIVFIALVSVIIGTVLAALASRIPLRPVNAVINAMGRLAAGDYKTRLYFAEPLAKHPTIKELTKSFNTMASELDKTEVLRSDFVNNFSHEFKTPIVSIAGFAKLLKHGDLTEEQKAEYIDIIEEESMRLSYMATNVLNLTKIENQTILTNVLRYNLSEQIRNCVLLLENKWSKKNIDLHINFDEHYIDANEELLKQVWINLIDNAVKFTPQNGRVQIDIGEKEDGTDVTVMNTGSQIAPENNRRIFNKFYQEDESHSTEGNGVGLAIVKRIVQLHRGTVTLQSTNMETAFTVSIPKQK